MKMNTEKDFNQILDECLDRVSRGETIESCLADYASFATELRPLLESASEVRLAGSFTPSMDAKRQARQRLMGAIDKSQKPAAWWWILSRVPTWATVAVVLVVVLAGLFSMNVITPPGTEPPTIVVSTPPVAGQGNFVFLVSDEPNDIGDFTSLTVTVDHVALLKKDGDSEAWIVFTPVVKEFDLTKLIGAASQELWRGDVPEGEYTKIEVFTSAVKGTLTTGEIIDIKLPSDKLQIGIPFSVGSANVTSFTFDITVNKTSQGAGKYILKPQAGESGATYQAK
jgi:hypothetical protein